MCAKHRFYHRGVSRKAQVLLEVALVFVAVLLLLIGMTRIWYHVNKDMTVRTDNYVGTRSAIRGITVFHQTPDITDDVVFGGRPAAWSRSHNGDPDGGADGEAPDADYEYELDDCEQAGYEMISLLEEGYDILKEIDALLGGKILSTIRGDFNSTDDYANILNGEIDFLIDDIKDILDDMGPVEQVKALKKIAKGVLRLMEIRIELCEMWVEMLKECDWWLKLVTFFLVPNWCAMFGIPGYV